MGLKERADVGAPPLQDPRPFVEPEGRSAGLAQEERPAQDQKSGQRDPRALLERRHLSAPEGEHHLVQVAQEHIDVEQLEHPRPALADVGQRDDGLPVGHLAALVLRVAALGRVSDEEVARLAQARVRIGAQRLERRTHQWRETQIARRAHRDDQDRSGPQRSVQRPQRALVRDLREVGEDREREREVERLLEGEPVREEVAAHKRRGHACLPTDVEDLLNGITPVEQAGRDVARQQAGQAAPAAAEVQDAGVGEPALAMACEAPAQPVVERRALGRERNAAGAVPQLLQRTVRHAGQQCADVGIGVVLLGQQQGPDVGVEVGEEREAIRAAARAGGVDGRQLLAVEVLEPRVEPVGCEARRPAAPRPQQASDPHGRRLSAV